MIEFLTGTTSLHALAMGFGLETDSQPQRARDRPDDDHQDRWEPTTPELNDPVDRITFLQHLGEKTLLVGQEKPLRAVLEGSWWMESDRPATSGLHNKEPEVNV